MSNENKPEAKPLSELVPQTLETLAYVEGLQTTLKPLDEKRLKMWAEKWLHLKTDHHKLLQELEREVYLFCRDYMKNPRVGRRLVIFGENGTGKSHCAKSVAQWAAFIAKGLPFVNRNDWFGLPRCEYVLWPEFCDEMKTGDFSRLEDMVDCEMLILDDVGAEHDPSKMAAEKLYWLLERREYKWMLITTNTVPLDWENRFERRVASRFVRNSRLVSLETVPDFNTRNP